MNTFRAGFTIVELLIVVVVIAILAAITIVSYNGITNQANDTAVQSDLSNFVKKASLYNVTNGTYPNFLQVESLNIDVSQGSYAESPTTTHNFNYCVDVESNNTVQTFAVVALSKSGAIYFATDSTAVQRYSGSWTTIANDMCAAVLPSYTNVQRGYASDDTTGGPWRAWVGGN